MWSMPSYAILFVEILVTKFEMACNNWVRDLRSQHTAGINVMVQPAPSVGWYYSYEAMLLEQHGP